MRRVPSGTVGGRSSATSWRSSVGSSAISESQVGAACVTGAGGSACSHRDRVQVRPSNSVSTGPRQYICEGAGVVPKNVARSAGLSSFIRSSQPPGRSEEHTSELQSLMRISYAVFCLKKKKQNNHNTNKQQHNT